MADAPTAPTANQPWLEVLSSREFSPWLTRQRISLGFTTYQSGKLFLLGVKPDGQIAVNERTFDRSMGLWADPDSQGLWLSTRYQLWRFQNAIGAGYLHEGHDRLYIPKIGHTTGDLDIHDLVVESTGRLVFVNTRFGCLATLNPRENFTPLWKPPFLTKLAPEDRCHLNGLTMENGRAAYVSAVAACDIADGWRDRRRDGGLIIDVRTGRTVVQGLSMPHSPRMHQGQLWVLNSGTGYLGRVDIAAGRFEPLSFCPGYLRGLAFVGDYAIVGLSRPRHERTFTGLSLDEELAKRGAEPRCGLLVIDLRTGDHVHWVRLEGDVSELYDVVALPGVSRPMAIGFKSDDIARLISVGEAGTL